MEAKMEKLKNQNKKLEKEKEDLKSRLINLRHNYYLLQEENKILKLKLESNEDNDYAEIVNKILKE